MRSLSILAVALAPLATAASKIGLVGVPDDQYECRPYPGGPCEMVVPVNASVHVHKDSTFEFLNDEVEKRIADLAYGTEACKEMLARVYCSTQFSICGDSQGIALKQLPCRDACVHTWGLCADIFDTAISFGVAGGVWNRGTKALSNDYSTEAPDGFGPGQRINDLYTAQGYPLSLEGQTSWPVSHSTQTLANGDTVQVECLPNASHFGGAAKTVEKECPFPLVYFADKGTCEFSCPLPLYSQSEFHTLYNVYVVIGTLTGIMCAVLLADSAFVVIGARRKNKDMIKARQSPIWRYQTLGAVAGLLFFITGPLLVLLFNDTENFGMVCESNSMPQFMDHSIPEYTTWSCSLNKSAIFFNMLLFNVLILHLLDVLRALKNSQALNNAKVPPGKKAAIEGAVVAIPMVLMIIALSIDGLDRESDAWVGSVARWTTMCGAQLSLLEEVMLVHVPFIISGVIVMVTCVRIQKVLRELAQVSSSGGRTGSFLKDGKDAVTRALEALSRKLSILGACTAILVVIFVVCSIDVVPKFTTLSKSFIDYFLCQSIGSTADQQLALYDSCADLFQDLETNSAGESYFTKRPSPSYVATLIAAQGMVPFLFSVFYLLVGRFSTARSNQKKQSQKRMRSANAVNPNPTASTSSATSSSASSSSTNP